MTKLLENIFRSVNIALVNELSILADRMGIDIWEVIDAASTKPYGFMRFEPGPGWAATACPSIRSTSPGARASSTCRPSSSSSPARSTSRCPNTASSGSSARSTTHAKPVNGSKIAHPRRQLQGRRRRHPRVARAADHASARRSAVRDSPTTTPTSASLPDLGLAAASPLDDAVARRRRGRARSPLTPASTTTRSRAKRRCSSTCAASRASRLTASPRSRRSRADLSLATRGGAARRRRGGGVGREGLRESAGAAGSPPGRPGAPGRPGSTPGRRAARRAAGRARRSGQRGAHPGRASGTPGDAHVDGVSKLSRRPSGGARPRIWPAYRARSASDPCRRGCNRDLTRPGRLTRPAPPAGRAAPPVTAAPATSRA